MTTTDEYLAAHPAIARLLPDVWRMTRDEFPTATLSLEVYTDHETGREHLTVYVRLNDYPENVFDRIAKIWQGYCGRDFGGGWLLVTTDFCAP